MRNKLLFLGISLLTLGSANVVMAYGDRSYFLDHQFIKPGTSYAVEYEIPANQFLQCIQDGPSGGSYGSIEWQYKDVTFKGQIGGEDGRLMVTLVKEDMLIHLKRGEAEVANTSGKLAITNLSDKYDLVVTCSYSNEND